MANEILDKADLALAAYVIFTRYRIVRTNQWRMFGILLFLEMLTNLTLLSEKQS